jgi:hypothetical protein
MNEELIKRHVTILEIRNNQPDITLADRYYYEVFREDILRYIHYIAYINLNRYPGYTIEKVVVINKFDITNHVLYNKSYIDKIVSEISTIPYIFEIDNINMLLNEIKEITESVIVGDIRVSVYFDFFIANELTMFFKYEIYKCLF